MRGRQMEVARIDGGGDAVSASAATRQIGALRVGLADNSIAIDASKLDAPSQGYDADVAWVDYRPGNVSLLFAKHSRDDAEVLQSRLEVRYPVENLILTFWKGSPEFYDKLQSYVESWPQAARFVAEPPLKSRAEKSHSEWASYAYLSHSGTAAGIDFYYLSSSAIARFAKSGSVEGLRLRPVVRVQLTSFALFKLLEQVRALVGEIEASVSERHRNEVQEQVE